MAVDDTHDAESTPEPGSDAPADPNLETAPDDAHEGQEPDVAALRSEAAGYRRRLRAAEAERDKLREQLDARDRADVERMAGETMASADDLWTAGGVTLEALRDPESGELSPQLVEEAVAGVLEQRPHWRKVAPATFDGGARRTPEPEPSFGAALKNVRRS
jgi:hypothetical protein